MKNATFIAELNGYYKWKVLGNPGNFYQEGKFAPNRMVQVIQMPYVFQDYLINTFQDKVDASIFDLPSYCEGKGKCADESVCNIAVHKIKF